MTVYTVLLWHVVDRNALQDPAAVAAGEGRVDVLVRLNALLHALRGVDDLEHVVVRRRADQGKLDHGMKFPRFTVVKKLAMR